MLTNIAFLVPGEPQGKGRARIGKIRGHSMMFPAEKTVAYEGLIAHAAAQVMRGAEPWRGPCAIEIDVVFSVPASYSAKKRKQCLAGAIRPTKKPDADNVLKACCDGINGVVWKDDAQAVCFTGNKRYGLTPGVFVRVAQLTNVSDAA